MDTMKPVKRSQMKLLRVKDNCVLPESDFAPVQHVVDKIADKSLGELEKEGVFEMCIRDSSQYI